MALIPPLRLLVMNPLKVLSVVYAVPAIPLLTGIGEFVAVRLLVDGLESLPERLVIKVINPEIILPHTAIIGVGGESGTWVAPIHGNILVVN